MPSSKTQTASSVLTRHRESLPALTGIRFFAAMQVVFFHFGAGFAHRHHAPAAFQRFLGNGWTAVPLFFILSGFILCYTYTGQIERHRGKARFWQARFARIYPVYLLSLLLCLPADPHLGRGLMLAVFTMVQAWNPLHVNYSQALNSPAWSLSTEAFFYLLFPFVLPQIEKLSTRALKTLAVLTLLAIALGHTIDPPPQWSHATLLPLPAFRFLEFLGGMLMGLIYLRDKPLRGNAITSYGSILAIFGLLVFIQGHWISLIVIPFAVLIYNLAAGDTLLARLLGGKSLLLLGGASYSIYLLQDPVRWWTHFAVTGSQNLKLSRGGIDMFLSPILLVFVSILAFLFYEEPARKWLRNWFKRRSKQREAVAA